MNPRSVTISLRVPPRALSPNGRENRFVKARITKAYRLLAWAETREAMKHLPQPLRLRKATAHAHFFFEQPRERDDDNLIASLKAAFDGIADAEAIVNDKVLSHQKPTVDLDKSNPRVEITITETP